MDADRVTELLQSSRRGDPDAAQRLIEAVHSQLREMANAKMKRERSDHTLQATALVNEAFLRLQGNGLQLEDRAHFFGAAARAMERVLVDHARSRKTAKRGGDAARVSFCDLQLVETDSQLDVLSVHDALAALEQESAEFATLVRYRYFVGLTLEQIAEVEGTSLATVKRRWTFARAWLYERLDG